MTLLRPLVLLVLLTYSAVALLAQQVTGTLTAQGNGNVRLYMASGTVQIAGNGALLVSHNAQVSFTGAAPNAQQGQLCGQSVDVYNGFNGSAAVTGTNFTVGLYGNSITLTASGTGFAFLTGTGSYTLTNASQQSTNGNWTQATSATGGNAHRGQRQNMHENANTSSSENRITFGQLNTVQATGSLTAQGVGSPRLHLAVGTVQIVGSGALMVSPNIRVAFAGPAPAATSGTVEGQSMLIYGTFNGSATISGANFEVGMNGKVATLSVNGAGAAYLLGTGDFAVSTAAGQTTNGNWTAAPTGNAQTNNMNAQTIWIGQMTDPYNISNYK